MSTIGPALPPHILAKRKRQQEEEDAQPILAATPAQIASRSSSPDSVSKRKRVLGPAPPPASIEERPVIAQTADGESSSEDEYGPVVPSKATKASRTVDVEESWETVRQNKVQNEQTDTKGTRDEWMLVPPSQDDLSARMDPTKIRARKFNTGKGASGAGQAGDNAIWTETPEQKRKRLRDQILGVEEASPTDTEAIVTARKRKDDEEKARKVKEYDVSVSSQFCSQRC